MGASEGGFSSDGGFSGGGSGGGGGESWQGYWFFQAETKLIKILAKLGKNEYNISGK